jgi:AbrB family looped-hinge helix DNA binding protein
MWHTGRKMADRVEIVVGPQGRIVIPARLRRALGLKPGDRMTAAVEDDRLVLERREAALGRLQAAFSATVPPGVSLVDALIKERRAEASRESRK